MGKSNELIKGFIKDSIAELTENIEELRNDKSEFANGQRLAYVECLEMFKRWVAGDEETYGLDGDLEKKFGLMN